MTLDEAIKHAEEVAKNQENNAKRYPRPNKDVKGSGRKYNACIKCAEEHQQLAEWLKELKSYKEQQPCEDCISRAAVETYVKEYGYKHGNNWIDNSILYKFLKSLPSVTPSYNSIKTELDCVSRQAVIQIIENKLNPCTDMFKCLEMSEIKEDVEHLPSVTTKTRWIPVSERLPEHNMSVLITVRRYDDEIVVRSGYYYSHGDDSIFHADNGNCWGIDEDGLLAWMPLPQPYTESEDEE